MTKLLINLIAISLCCAFWAPRNAEKITFRLASRWMVIGTTLLFLVGVFGAFQGQPWDQTFLILDKTNDHQMGVILGVGAIYIASLCCVYSLSRTYWRKN